MLVPIETQKVVINEKYGGFKLSLLGLYKIRQRKKLPTYLYQYKECFAKTRGLFDHYWPLSPTLSAGQIEFFLAHIDEIRAADNYTRYFALFDQDIGIQDTDNLVAKTRLQVHRLSEFAYDEQRQDPDLIAVVQTLQKAANGTGSNLRIRTLGKSQAFQIVSDDGYERLELL